MVPGGPRVSGLAPPPPQQHAGKVQARPIIASVGATTARSEPPPKTRKRPLVDLPAFKNLLIGPELTSPVLKLRRSKVRSMKGRPCSLEARSTITTTPTIRAVGLRDTMLGGFAAQLGKPAGRRGWVVGSMLNRTNRGLIAMAVDALELKTGATAADLGFGGGVGLALLLERAGPGGHVVGVDISPTMARRASRHF